MIPKKIHYCWFGYGKLPKLEESCVKSWARFMPDFDIIRWDESSFDVNSVPFTREAYKAKKYAFVADYVRIHALLSEGGIYLDTDVEIIRPLDSFINTIAFGGFETPSVIQTGVIGSTPGGRFMQKMFQYYHGRHFRLSDGSFDQTPNSAIFAELLKSDGIVFNNTTQNLPDISIFSSDYFCPINQANWEICVTENTYCIHYLSGSWLPRRSRFSRSLKALLGNIFGFKFVSLARKVLLAIHQSKRQ